MKKKLHFFTLVEILTVMAILAILAGIVVGGVVVVNSKNAETQTLATIKALEIALTQFKNENGTIYKCDGWDHTNFQTPIRVLIEKDIPADVNGTLWKYLDQKLINSATKELDASNRYFIDAWGRPLVYRIPGKFNSSSFDLGSKGPDGKYGDGSDDYKDFGKGDDITNFVRKQ